MKKVLGKITGIVMAFAVAVSYLSVAKVDAKAATAINVNQEYKVSLSYKQSAEYTFVTPNDAVTSVEAVLEKGGNYSNASIKLTVDYCNYSKMYVRAGEGRYTTPGFVFAPGHTATITVDDVSYLDDVVVSFKVNCVNPGNVEKEGNNAAGSATKLSLKKVYNGVVSYVDSDVDWYVFKAPKTGKYKFYAVNTLTSGYSSVLIEGFKTKTKKDTNFSTYLRSGEGWVKSKTVKLKKGKKYYIKLSNASYLDTIPTQIRVKKVK